MKYGKSFFLSIAASAAVVLTGCGAGSSTDSTGTDAGVKAPAAVITVERGPVLDANVTDANGTQGHELGNGQYAFDNAPQYPITAIGGYIDVNRNGKIDAGEVKNTLKLQAKAGDVVTIATTLAEDKNVSQLLETAFDLKPEDIETKTPGMDKKVEALSNMVYAYAMEHNVSDLSDFNATQLMAMKEQFHETVQNYKDDAKDAAEHEEALMQRLQMPTLDDADAQQVQEMIQQKIEEHQQKQENAQGAASSAMTEAGDQVKDMFESGMSGNGDMEGTGAFGNHSSAGGNGDMKGETEEMMQNSSSSSMDRDTHSSAGSESSMGEDDAQGEMNGFMQSGSSSSMEHDSHSSVSSDASMEENEAASSSQDFDAETMLSGSSSSVKNKGGFSVF